MTAPISNEPTTTRLHHYAGRYCATRRPSKSRMQFQQSLHTHWAQNGRISTTQFHNLKYLEGNCMRNLSPADERRPQGLRAHIHTFTMRAFSDSSAKKFAHCGPSRSSSAKNSPGTPPSAASPVQNSPNTNHTGPLQYKTRPAHPHQCHTR